MSYTELLAERDFMHAEKARCQTALDAALEIDPRGMWQERFEVWDLLQEMVEGCEWAIKYVEAELLKRFEEKK